MSGNGLGRLPAADLRDTAYPLRALTPEYAPMPNYRTWFAPHSWNQGATSMCVGFSWHHFLLASPLPNNRGPLPEQIYRQAQLLDEFPGEGYDGTTVRAGAKALQALGLVTAYHWASTAEEVAEYLLMKGPVVFGTDWLEGMDKPGPLGFAKATGRGRGGHAYLCIGYNRSSGNFRFLNSWGPEWGDMGRFTMTGEDVAKLLAGGGEACAAVEAKAK